MSHHEPILIRSLTLNGWKTEISGPATCYQEYHVEEGLREEMDTFINGGFFIVRVSTEPFRKLFQNETFRVELSALKYQVCIYVLMVLHNLFYLKLLYIIHTYVIFTM